MPSIRPTLLRVFAISWGVLTYIATATSLFAQSPSFTRLPPVETPIGGSAVATGDDIPQGEFFWPEPSSAVVDYPPVQRIANHELQPAGTPKLSNTELQPKPERIEVGKDRTLIDRWDNGFVAETADKSFRIHHGGRFDFDNSWFSQDDNILIGPSADQTMRDGTLFRRARLRADGRVWEFIDFACEVNFANIQDVSNVDNSTVQIGSVGLTDFNLTFREFPWLGNVRVGHLQAPISLERYSSSNAWYYMERSSMFDAFYNPNDYQNGVLVFNSYLDDRVTLAASAAWIGKSDVQSFARRPRLAGH